ncbi:urea transport system permease protein [Aequitasia blattaphilus]|uniref:Urea ABC transporter permease subunit UrtC n=1 Tax=Aequitasia blattaphilus TaxID=2949332 RepID=A0ABT1E984_9FIRM|nr:urea ABC transporter permease subunit UrtC [Aequitasia blattaphilus]MCP1102251.1 urea ABC transporter permease subunit UrtC [Aequitasia blattaphilus]MCR8614891.1 urea ABC transporter permease subunit UrtC [Aequitasia blattaphilus]
MKIKKQGYNICFAVIVVILALMPVLLNAGVISSNSFILFLGKCIAFSIVAIGLDLIWGYTGILSLGHGLYFALGGYAMAMFLKLQATDGNITSFMQTGGMTKLPLMWKPFLSGYLSVILIIAIPAVLAATIGYFIFRNRIKGVYFSIISQALTWAAYSLFTGLQSYTGGNVGITEIKSIIGSIKGDANTGKMFILFYISLAILVLIYGISYFLTHSKFGKILIAIRDGENRTYFSGYCVSTYKNFIYVLSAIFAAVAGAIFVNFNGSITPTQMTISYSITMVIWVAVGGRGTLVGAVMGAFLINLCDYHFSSGVMVEAWQYILGTIFVVTILFFKGGLVGVIRDQLPILIRRVAHKER